MEDNFVNQVADAVADKMYDPYNVKVPDMDAVNLNTMLSERKLWLNTEVDENMICCYRQIILWNMQDKDLPIEQRKPIHVYIINWGGVCEFGWAMVDLMLSSKTPIYTVNLGMCGSAASYIFLAGAKRYMMPRAKVVVHEGSAEISGDAQKVRDANDDYKKTIEMAYKYVNSRTGIPVATLKKKKNNDWYIDADECLKLGICTNIVESIEDII